MGNIAYSNVPVHYSRKRKGIRTMVDRYDLWAFIISLTSAFMIGFIMGSETLTIAIVVGLSTYIGIRLLEYL